MNAPFSAAGLGGAAPVLVTGVAGFIGFQVARRLLSEGVAVVGADCVDAYYDVSLKEARLRELTADAAFTMERLDLADGAATADLFRRHRPEIVIHLAAQPGVRYSLIDPAAYTRSNIAAFVNVLEGCRHGGIRHLVYASSSSVYGTNTAMPFRTSDPVDRPVSLYGATKKANEVMAHAYSHLFGLPTTGLRFFTVYGPWGRPDMAVYLFTRAIAEGRPIDLFNQGRMSRDFTYIDDIVEGVVRVAARIPEAGAAEPGPPGERPDAARPPAPYRIYNIGSDAPVELGRLVASIERAVGRSAIVNLLPMQPGDVVASWADIEDLARDVGFRPSTPIEEGVARFVAWYRAYHGV